MPPGGSVIGVASGFDRLMLQGSLRPLEYELQKMSVSPPIGQRPIRDGGRERGDGPVPVVSFEAAASYPSRLPASSIDREDAPEAPLIVRKDFSGGAAIGSASPYLRRRG